MAKNIEPNLRKIGDYLKLEEDVIFTIPEYQRAYSWEASKQCDKLWNDIRDFAEGSSKDNYFFGTIIISCEDNDTKFGLIDGQQRTTTFLLLLKALLMNINTVISDMGSDEESQSLLSGLEDRRRKIMGILYKVDAEDISNKPNPQKDADICSRPPIVKSHSINEQYRDDLAAILRAVDYAQAQQSVVKFPRRRNDNQYTNYFRNFKFFYETTGTLSESQLNSITKTIIEKCEVIEIKSWNVEQAITMFNSLNSDGLPLYDADIISAQLYASAEKQGEREEFTSRWEELLGIIGDLNQKGIANIDSILMQQMYYERTLRKETINPAGGIDVTTPGLRRYYIDINKELISDPIRLCQDMVNLSKIWSKVSEYPCVQVLLKFNDNAKLFLASYFYRFNFEIVSEELILPIVECLMKLFTILELVDVGYSSKNFKTFLFREEAKLIDPDCSVSEISDDFMSHIADNWNREDIKNAVKDCDKHVLVYLNEYLFAKEASKDFSLDSRYDIEHIMPASGSNLLAIRKDAELEDEDEFRSMVNKLGNKILLEEKINRSLGNEWFRTKVSTCLKEKTGYIDSAFPLAGHLVAEYANQAKPFWKKGDISTATEAAGERIAAFIFDGPQ